MISNIHSKKAPEPVGAYPHAKKVGDFLFLSGVGPRKLGSSDIPGTYVDPEGNVVGHDITIQTHAVIENVKYILEEAGSSLDKLVDITVFLTDMKADFKKFNEIYAHELGQYGATRTTIEVGALPTSIAIEFKVIALA
ncbi:MAG: RidA family protein [Bdellovibrionaceae bacterium]|nr:RidA family protein [Pseudobdellovibrionaceae bacterium]